jgi:hypothetical protein
MDQSNIVIQSAKALKKPQVEVTATDGKIYIVDLNDYSKVKCFPTSQSEWEKVGISTYGFNLTWSSRFEVHVDQLIDAAISSTDIQLHA